MPEKSLQQRLHEAAIVIHEPIKLRSGEISDFYADIKKVYGDPELLEELARATVENIDSRTTCIAAAGYGGIPLGVEVARLSKLPLAMVRDTEKNHGRRGMIDGYVPQPHDLVTIVDDVFTTGSSLAQTARTLTEKNATVIGCNVIVTRGNTEEFHLPISSLFASTDLDPRQDYIS